MVTGFSGVADELQIANLVGTKLSVPVFAGFCTGALYKSTTGPRGALLAGSLGAVATCALSVGYGQVKTMFFKKGRY